MAVELSSAHCPPPLVSAGLSPSGRSAPPGPVSTAQVSGSAAGLTSSTGQVSA
ncbi:hypothetical protein B0E53_06537 [Micromonospora sp. MH33]|nr:hypothetical protein B0E53_06537 [Micromonospora sp. MH33]